jgi:hypothetical protein
MSEAQHCIALHTGGEVGGAVTEVEEIHGILQVRFFFSECTRRCRAFASDDFLLLLWQSTSFS